YSCGKEGHKSKECKATTPTCFNCGEEGHKSPECKKPKKVTGKVFALNGEGADQVDNLIRGTCFIHDTPLIAIIDTGATHSFISMDCMKRLNIPVYEMSGCMNIETPASGSVITRLVCRNCPVSVFGRHFGMDLSKVDSLESIRLSNPLTMTAARANAQIAESLATLTHLLARGDDPARDGEKRLGRFLKHKPSFFVGGFNPDGAVKWVEEVEIIFDAMECANENNLALGTYMLREEANQWWKNAKLRIGDRGVVITWEMFKREFFNKYFPADVKNKKVVEFMKLEQGNMSVAEYAAKFESLCAFSPHYNTPEAENDKCVKFESG
ncbi:hypothetical protein TSUD_416460, partial [Trifolium subterraneum]